MSIRSFFAKQLIHSTMRIGYWANCTIEQQRSAIAKIDRFAPKLPVDARVDVEMFDGIPCEWISFPRSHQDKIIVFVHGGGFATYLPQTYRSFAARVSMATQMKVFSISYRLAPEFPFPAGLEDVDRAYRALRMNPLDGDRKIFLMADSAGAALALACLQRWRATQTRLPRASVFVSPWLDLTLESESMTARASRDPMLNYDILNDMRRYYLSGNGFDPKQSNVSPLFGELSHLPPFLILAGSEEILFDDFARLHERAQRQGTSSELKIFEGMWHCFPMTSDFIPESHHAIDEIKRFLAASV